MYAADSGPILVDLEKEAPSLPRGIARLFQPTQASSALSLLSLLEQVIQVHCHCPFQFPTSILSLSFDAFFQLVVGWPK